jgi:hypothetical protein
MPPGQEVVGSLKYDAFGELPIILVAKAQGQVLVASECKKFFSVSLDAEVT